MPLNDIAKKFKHRLVGAPADPFGLTSYSQEGEDMVLRRFVGDKLNGFYVDIGAHHPKRFSNTYYFYKLGWRGINVDADPLLIKEFDSTRPDDINIACGVGNSNEELTFYVFDEPAINTFDSALAQERVAKHGYRIVREEKIAIKKLDLILNEFLPTGQKIDFMSVDVEGKDLEVLKSNNWLKYRPRFLLVECLDTSSLEKVLVDGVTSYLKGVGYKPIAKSLFTVFFADTENPA